MVIHPNFNAAIGPLSISNGAAIARPGANFGGPQGVVVLQRSRDRSCQRWRGWTNPAFGCYLRQLCPPEIHPRHQSTVHKLDKCDTLVTLWDICLQPAKARPIHLPTVGDALGIEGNKLADAKAAEARDPGLLDPTIRSSLTSEKT
ncbi:hypothetical protein PCANC_06256 [Puccinia coronata f. sp. avenae]|uniref:Uncharacterized protein n=1 Tax=Puccinia coronata f. sp. avenae TaxID=200324 RepID=A0A2N5V3A3_9BASI|nr:hypothetical protein PCANC_06256 [Puccinia coronata f. sp. avenae]